MTCVICGQPANPRLRTHPEIPRCDRHKDRTYLRKCLLCGQEKYLDRKNAGTTLCDQCNRTKPRGKVGLERWIVTADAHVPYHDRKLHKILLSYLADHCWDGWLHLGDLMDFDAISHHTKEQIRRYEGKRIKTQYDEANRWLDEHQSTIRENNPEARFVLLEGNHDYWIERYLDVYPQLEGLLEVENALRLKDRGIEWIRCEKDGTVFELGKATFIHGWYANKYHAFHHVQTAGTNIFYGHVHDFQEFSFRRRGDDATIVGRSIGCLRTYDADYLRGKPTNWQLGFSIFHFFPDGFFQHYDVRVFQGRFVSPEGTIYQS